MGKKDEIPGARRLSAKAKSTWDEQTAPEQIPNFRQVVYNTIHNYCFFLCTQPSCDGCKVVDLRAWVANMKELPQNMGTPVVRELNAKKLEKAEAKTGKLVVENAKTHVQSDQPE